MLAHPSDFKDRDCADAKARSRFLSQFVHELRTPLHAIVGFAQLLEMHPGLVLGEAPRNWIEGMTQAAWHLQDLLGDLQDGGLTETGQLPLQIQCVEIEPLVVEVLNMVQLQADHAGIRLVHVVHGGPSHFAQADPLRLRQILLNLLTNAIKYGRQGGHVRVELAAEEDRLHLQVIDNGMGMHRKQLAHLFEPFNRLGREASAIEGSGIGLALARHWVLRMHGGISVESELGVGTTVNVHLPAAPDPSSSLSTRSSV